MALPAWQDRHSGGGMVRAALWLETEVGLGNTFTKAQLRAAFPDDAQIDRRVRDLRDFDWRIDTSRDDPALRPEEQRYVSRGAEVWISGQARPPKHKSGLTATQRIKVMQADNFLCRTCGIGAGEPYGDGIELSKLNVARRKVRVADGAPEIQLVTECGRCGVAGGEREANLGDLLRKVKALAPLEQKVLAGWIKSDRRATSELERLWGIYRTLPEESREAIVQCVIQER
ncbi:MAG TPA: hypothetical protein DGG94_09565 [Micromonosporaceae bacterium]|nr:hypothetical protein [Micromonosporaceae bacterium]HCU50030.1 hypothetical protein [Micromonosporaceae bacterium]